MWDIWKGLETQWHTQIVGKALIYDRLDHASAWVWMKALRVPKTRRAEMMEQLQQMEVAALSVLNER